MAIAPDASGGGLLAAGTFARGVGLYDAQGSGGEVAVWNLQDGAREGRRQGAGVTSLHWSACARYLYVFERRSDAVLVYDIRVTGREVASLAGRAAGGTNQRLGGDVVDGTPGDVEGTGHHEVWAGGGDGWVRRWRGAVDEEDVGIEMGRRAEGGFMAHEGMSDEFVEVWDVFGRVVLMRATDPVTSTTVHPFMPTLVATCSGQRRMTHASPPCSPLAEVGKEGLGSEAEVIGSTAASSGLLTDDDDGVFLDNSLKIWLL